MFWFIIWVEEYYEKSEQKNYLRKSLKKNI